MNKLLDIHQQFDTDKGTYHSYIEKYDELLAPYQNEFINFLEIGCLTCGSLKMFNTFFSNAQIYGLDNWIQNTDHMGHSLSSKGIDLNLIIDDIKRNYPRINLITCDSTSIESVKVNLKDLKFKIIIDDGDHSLPAQYNTFKNFIPYLEHGGIYIIEDVGHIQDLLQLIGSHIRENNLNLNVEGHTWYKGNRADDAIILIR